MIYGANGYTGALIAREAVHRGLRPVLGGRNGVALGRLAAELGLEARVFALDGARSPAASLAGIRTVLHCAGPFSATAAPMMSACMEAGAHYLDITGEVDVFEQAQARSAQARAAGIVLCPGVGFDVVPTDCVALALKEAMPAAVHLALGFDGRSSWSRGTAKTMIEGLATGGRVRLDGRLVRVPLAYQTRRIDFGGGEKFAVTIPWGDVSTAFHTTGIPNIEVYVPLSPQRVAGMRRMNYLRWAFGFGPVLRFMKSRVDRQAPGPEEDERARTPTHVWGEARDAGGARRVARIEVANGYTVTVHAALGVAQRLLNTEAPAGAITPARLMGAHYVEALPGSGRIEIT